MAKQDYITGGGDAARGGWLQEEPLGWVLATMAMGAQWSLLFGFNGVRCAMDGHGMIVPVLGIGAALGCWCVWSAARELRRRWKEKKRQGRKIEG